MEDTSVDAHPPVPANDRDGVVREIAVEAGTTRMRRRAPSRHELVHLLGACNGSVAEVARRLNRQYAVVWRCIQRYGIDAGAYRKNGS